MAKTNETGYTAGPWRIDGGGNIDGLVVDADGLSIASVSWRKPRNGVGGREFEANARLIAAAPELAEALRVSARAEAMRGEVGYETMRRLADEHTRAALAKAGVR